MPLKPSSSSAPLTPELVQQMIVNTFSALSILGKSQIPFSIWYLYAGAQLSHLTKYTGNRQIQTAYGGKLPMTAIGDTSSIMPLKYLSLPRFNYKSSFSWTTC